MIPMSSIICARVRAEPVAGWISCRLVPRKETGLPLMRIRPSLSANSRKPTRCERVSITFPAGSRRRSTAVYRFGCSADQSFGDGTTLEAFAVASSPSGTSTGRFRGRDQTAWPRASYSWVSTV